MNYNEPMGLPQGSVRAIITLVLIAALIALVFMGKTSSYLEVLASAAFGYYFGTRSTETAANPKTESEVPISLPAEEEVELSVVSGKDLD